MYGILDDQCYKSISKLFGGVLLLVGLLSCSTQSSKKLPDQGKPRSTCTFLSSKALVKLYSDDGSLSIGTTDYTVTYQDEHIEEAIIFYSVSSPFVEFVECRDHRLLLHTGEFNVPPMEIELDWITKELVKSPLRFYKSNLSSPEYASHVKGWKQITIPTPTPPTSP